LEAIFAAHASLTCALAIGSRFYRACGRQHSTAVHSAATLSSVARCRPQIVQKTRQQRLPNRL